MDRRLFIQRASGFIAAASLDRIGAQAPRAPAVKTVRTNVLEIGYHESGNPAGFPVILLHGFPDDAHAYDGVAPALAKSGYRALAVYLRGYGPTRFLDPAVARTAEQAAIGQDVIDFADALKLRRFVVAGFDWGGRAACVASALHPDRVRAAVLIGGYSIQNTVTPACARGRPQALVSVVLQHRRRPRGPRAEPARVVRAPLAGVVADVALQRGDVQPHGGVVRQP